MTHTTIPPKHTVGVELVSAEDAYRAGLPMRPVLAAVERGEAAMRVLPPDGDVVEQAKGAARTYGATYRGPARAAASALAGIAKARQKAEDWARVAEFLAARPEVAARVWRCSTERVLCPLGTMEDPAGFISAVARAAVADGVRVEAVDDGTNGGIELIFGTVRVFVFTDADRVYTQRVVEGEPLFTLPEQGEAGEGQ